MLLAVVLGLIACKDNDKKVNANIISIDYYGNKFLPEDKKSDVTEFRVNIASRGIFFDDNGMLLSGSGYDISINIFDVFGKNTVPTGNFPFSVEYTPMVTVKGGHDADGMLVGSFYNVIENGEYKNEMPLFITEGEFSITPEGDKYRIKLITTIDGKEQTFIGFYDGKLKNVAYPYKPLETTTQDWTLSSVAYGAGFASIDENIYYCKLVNASKNQALELNIMVEEATLDKFAEGVFTVSEERHPGIVMNGDYMGMGVGSFMGIYNPEKDVLDYDYYNTIWYLASGTVTITKADNIYTLVLDGKSYFGSTLKAKFTGEIPVEDITPPEF